MTHVDTVYFPAASSVPGELATNQAVSKVPARTPRSERAELFQPPLQKSSRQSQSQAKSLFSSLCVAAGSKQECLGSVSSASEPGEVVTAAAGVKRSGVLHVSYVCPNASVRGRFSGH